MAGSWADPAQLQAALDTVERVATAPGRRLTFAMSHHWFKAVGFDVKARFPGCRISPLESGPDGADESLIRAAREDRPEHGDTVVIVSGDGGFAPLAGELAGRGIDVTVVGWHHRTSRRLRLACTTFVAVEDIASRPVSPQAADAA
jgi:uroporphyrinogen-III synthase